MIGTSLMKKYSERRADGVYVYARERHMSMRFSLYYQFQRQPMIFRQEAL